MNEDDKQNEVNEITELLIRLRPARSQLDSRAVFYEAGYSAGRYQTAESLPASHRRPRYGSLIAASLIVAAVTAPASYHVGQFIAAESATKARTKIVVTDDYPDETPIYDESMARESSPNVEDPVPVKRSKSFARWIDPLGGITEHAKLEREAETTLAAFHSAFVSSDQTDRNWIDFPFSTTLAKYRDSFDQAAINTPESQLPLAVGDLQQLAQSLESVR